jgi:hypothetical protein
VEYTGQDQPEQEAPSITYGGTALLLQYSYLRSSWIVARALAEAFPTEEAWLNALNEPELQEAMDSFGQVIEEIQRDLGTMPSPEAMIKLGEQHSGRAMECIEAFAERIGVSPRDLLLVSINI